LVPQPCEPGRPMPSVASLSLLHVAHSQ
jgi:hypothetical protein